MSEANNSRVAWGEGTLLFSLGATLTFTTFRVEAFDTGSPWAALSSIKTGTGTSGSIKAKRERISALKSAGFQTTRIKVPPARFPFFTASYIAISGTNAFAAMIERIARENSRRNR
ncbi:MAG: hypothetical protein BWX44_01682 [Spirochaetes bacterium ADurb.Bin001]|nr:MAG: hypothetical protein BWX44_01682 [Spirochaetes bacterium ADurb.Bin001]